VLLLVAPVLLLRLLVVQLLLLRFRLMKDNSSLIQMPTTVKKRLDDEHVGAMQCSSDDDRLFDHV
jgi:hypothetical protein